MDKEQALEILSKLADGVNPYTSKELKPTSPYQHPDTVRSLYMAISAMQHGQRNKHKSPENAGSPWEQSEIRKLVKAFDSGMSIPVIAKAHKRTVGAIRARLETLGKNLQNRPD